MPAPRGGMLYRLAAFLIGMRLNRPWRVDKWWPLSAATGPMLKELQGRPGLGLIHLERALIGGPAGVQ